jgi:hypothetical protein
MAYEGKRLDVLNPVEGKDGKTRWTKIGAVFDNNKGSWSGMLTQLPVNGRVVLRAPSAKKEEEA